MPHRTHCSTQLYFAAETRDVDKCYGYNPRYNIRGCSYCALDSSLNSGGTSGPVLVEPAELITLLSHVHESMYGSCSIVSARLRNGIGFLFLVNSSVNCIEILQEHFLMAEMA